MSYTLRTIRELIKSGPFARPYAVLRRYKRKWKPITPDQDAVVGSQKPINPIKRAELLKAVQLWKTEPRIHFSLAIDYLENQEPELALASLGECSVLNLEATERVALHTARALVMLEQFGEAAEKISIVKISDLNAEESILLENIQERIREALLNATC